MTASPTLVGRVLVGSLMEEGTPARDALGELVSGRDLTGLAGRARAHRVGNAVVRALRPLEAVDGSQLELLRRDADESLRRHLRALVDLGELGKALDAEDVPWLVVKGPVVSQLYGDDTLRTYADLDVVVPRRWFRRAAEAAMDAGFPVVQTDWAVAVRELAGEMCLILPYGTALDLHWDLLYHAQSRAAFAIDLDEAFERAVTVELAGTRVATLDPTDTLLHLSLHAAKGGGARLQWLKDIERSVAIGDPDWDAVVRRSRRWGVSLVVGVMLDRARAVLGARVPRDALAALGGAPWRRLALVAGRISPVERSVARRSLSSLIVRSTARDGWSSVRALARQARVAARRPLPGRPAFDLSEGRDDALTAFLDAVSGEGSTPAGGERSWAGGVR